MLFTVLLAALAFVLFIIFFVADVDAVPSLRRTAVFFMVLAVVTFGFLLFTAAAALTVAVEEEERVDLLLEPELAQAEPEGEPVGLAPGVCPVCATSNPPAANFCNACGSRLTG